MGGKGGRAAPPPPPPAAPPPPPTQVSAIRAVTARGTAAGRTTAENIRNKGGGRGIDTAGTQRALKGLTGQ